MPEPAYLRAEIWRPSSGIRGREVSSAVTPRERTIARQDAFGLDQMVHWDSLLQGLSLANTLDHKRLVHFYGAVIWLMGWGRERPLRSSNMLCLTNKRFSWSRVKLYVSETWWTCYRWDTVGHVKSTSHAKCCWLYRPFIFEHFGSLYSKNQLTVQVSRVNPCLCVSVHLLMLDIAKPGFSFVPTYASAQTVKSYSAWVSLASFKHFSVCRVQFHNVSRAEIWLLLRVTL